MVVLINPAVSEGQSATTGQVLYRSPGRSCLLLNRLTHGYSLWARFFVKVRKLIHLDSASNRNETKNLSGVKERPALKAENVTDVCDPIV
jgi:hypothetical protein